MLVKSKFLAVILVLIFFGLNANLAMAWSSAPEKDPAPASHPTVFDQVEEFTLDNGMLFLLLPRHDVPMVSGFITVKVGNVDNPEGSTGLAHMFEHMAFKGTDRIGSSDASIEKSIQERIAILGKELSTLVRSAAVADTFRTAFLHREIIRLGKLETKYTNPTEFPRTYDKYTYNFNAYTSQDITAYHATLPANNLEVWMLMESERLQHPVFREFYSEVEVVKEERRSRTEDNPEDMARELLKSLAFKEHPYHYPTIGYMEDLETLDPSQIDAFWKKYYTPSNMVAALVGDFPLEETKAMIENYFGDIPTGPLPNGPETIEPEQKEMRRGSHYQGAESRLLMAFPGFEPGEPHNDVARVLSSILSRDETSRLDRRLDFEEGVSRRIYTSSTGGYKRYRGLFTITVDLMGDATNEQVEELVWQELDRLQTDPVSQGKIDEIAASYRKHFIFGLQKNADLAKLLARTQTTHGKWQWAYEQYNRYDQITVDDVTTLAAQIFDRDKASVVYLEPEKPIQETEGVQP